MKALKTTLAIVLLGLLSLLPLRWAQAIGRFIGQRIYRRKEKSKLYQITQRNLQRCFPELSQAEQEQLLEESLEQTGCALAEMGMSWLWPVKRSLKTIVKVENEALITQALAEGRGVILIAPHLGNWEILNLYLSGRYPFTAMYKPPKQKRLDDLIKKMRARLGTRMAPASVQGVRMVMKALKKGEMVGILPDQEPELEGGIFAPFFNIPALTMKLLPQLAAQTQAQVVCGYAKRLDSGKGFEIYFVAADPETNAKDLAQATAAMNRSVEQCVRALPAQYQWEYKRFNTRPEGETHFY
ncbi:lysophospholipid acyltransferase family protein [Nitrincola tapanii]|uniref:Lauroyl acyltransferase n=1 Tax=Nitrincola tapanii TaxID=1708751 RepID=A0A5A9W0X7_9GAMM|nr:lysophospholipid acyltransferase family protein [Nitrincola tapanii]KAA0873775.1 lauroyl acyltransferase [Nitrincola tapanii]